MFDSLERRRLFAAGAAIAADGAFFVEGSFKNDRVAIFQSDDGETLFAKVNGVTHRAARAGVTKIVVDSKRGDDVVEILSAVGGVIDLPITVWTHAGNDTIAGGDGPERLNAGDDDDVVHGGNGRDTIYGGPGPGADLLRGGGGSDLIDGEDGPDTLRGDAGNDNLSGGANADHVRGSAGNDALRGGGGNDYLAGDDGDDQLFGDAGIDYLDGGAGRDFLRGGAGHDALLVNDSDPDDFDMTEASAGETIDAIAMQAAQSRAFVGAAAAALWAKIIF